MLNIMTAGHLAVAIELGLNIDRNMAYAIAKHDLLTSTCITGTHGEYVVYKTSKSITGDMHFLTKLYVPEKLRGKGLARALLNSCETPLVTSDKLEQVR